MGIVLSETFEFNQGDLPTHLLDNVLPFAGI